MKSKNKLLDVKFQPVGETILVLRDETVTVTPGGITLPSSSLKNENAGLVVAHGKPIDSKSTRKCPVSAGDRILFKAFSGRVCDHPDAKEDMVFVLWDDVVAIVTDIK